MPLQPLFSKSPVARGTKPERVYDLLQRPVEVLPSWVEPSIFVKQGIALFGGEKKIGKSLILGSLSRALVAGESPFLAPNLSVPQKARVLIIDQEVGEHGLQTRMGPMLADLNPDVYRDRLWFVAKDMDLTVDTEKGIDALRKHIYDAEPNVLILDPIGKLFSCDENDNVKIAKIGHTLYRICKEFASTGLSTVICHHFGKPPRGKQNMEGYDPLDFNNFRGASSWTGFADTLIACERGDKLGLPWQAWKITMRIQPRHGEEPPDMHLTVNEHKDFRVRFSQADRRFVPRLDGSIPKANVETTSGHQQSFALV
jgi:hypothetical protein